jgi:hypothetical protein
MYVNDVIENRIFGKQKKKRRGVREGKERVDILE